jgi:hypothetical protein
MRYTVMMANPTPPCALIFCILVFNTKFGTFMNLLITKSSRTSANVQQRNGIINPLSQF